jgi:GH35 family endo-1,4-beta-xylanase
MKRSIICLLFGFLAARPASAQHLIAGNPIADDFPIVSGHSGPVPIYVDPNDHWLVHKAAELLRDDILRVTGATPEIITDLAGGRNLPFLIIVGSIDKSSTVQRLIPSGLKGKWESYVLKTIRHPIPGIGQALIIAGSDRRGTSYGVFELSRSMGVSPWYYWADVPVPHKDELFFRQGVFASGPPAVKYRGFFINDEAPALSGWTREKFGGFNHLFYEHVFELLLRLRANYLWPAMWGSAFNDDDTLNPVLASQYGIVMGTSHHEPMLRAQQEWKRYGNGPWNYQTNAAVLDSFWEKGIEHMDHHESIVTVGMRGDGDMPMTEGSNIALLEKIVSDQRAILRKVTGKDPASTPQSWALYKEVQDYYDKGMRVPDDVTLLLCDDNWGDVRKLPQLGEKPRAGGYGMYYHFDYVGGPRNYKWINTNQLSRVWEEMHLTREYGDDRIWVVNVGDIKPMEFPIEFFLDYAWDPGALPADHLPDYAFRWASRQFGPEHAAAIADILTEYTKYNARRKPELLSPDTYSLLNYREAETVAREWKNLSERAVAIDHQLPEKYHDAYFELVLYPVLASANLNELYFTVARNRLYAAQGRPMANDLAAEVRTLFAKDSLLSYTYNHEIAGGKWPHMMDQTHIGYTSWQEPRYNSVPHVDTLDLTATPKPSWGVSVEGSAATWPSDSASAILPTFNPYDHLDHFIDIFSRGLAPFSYTATADVPWIHIGPNDRLVDKEQRLWIHVDWSQVPAGRHEATITINGPDGAPVKVTAPFVDPAPSPGQSFKGFIETGGYVAIEAEHFSKAPGREGIFWQVIPGLGRTLSGVEAMPVTAPAQTPDAGSPHLEYSVWLFDTGAVTVQAYCSPIIAFNRIPIHYAVAFDDETPQVIDLTTGNEDRGKWDKMVADNIRIAISRHRISTPGEHVLKFYLVDPGVVLQRLVIDAGGAKTCYLGPPESPTTTPQQGLKDYYSDYFPIGVSVSSRSITGSDSAIIIREFNSLTPENSMKMGPIHPQENRYNWRDADAIVDFAVRHVMRVRGHNLCWHEQTPPWLFKDSTGATVTKEVLLQRLKDHIAAVVGRYKGRVYAWDVVNEAIDDDSTKFLRNSPWYRICGDEYIAKAFEYAHAADPQAQLFYNDYNTERPEKRERVYRLLKQLVDAGVPITGVGLQGHWSIYEPSAQQLQAAIDRFTSLGLKVQITELDVSVYPWEKSRRARRPDESDAFTPDLEQRQADQYKMIFSIFRTNATAPSRKVTGVTFWNVTDCNTWLDNYPVPGRKNYPLLFNTDGQRKKAYWDVVKF